jgi:hypothetical protein
MDPMILIGIAGALLCLGAIWGSKCAIVVKAQHQVLTAWWGGKPDQVLKPGLHFIFWPFVHKYDTIEMKRYTHDIPTINVVCKVNPRAFEDTTVNDVVGTGARGVNISGTTSPADLQTVEFSLNFEVCFFKFHNQGTDRRPKYVETKTVDPQKIENYFRYTANTPEDNRLKDIIEEVVDMIESRLRAVIRTLDIFDAIKLDPEYIRLIKASVQKECEDDSKRIPVHIVSLKMGKPLAAVDPVIVKAIETISQGAILSNSDRIELARKRRIAEESIAIEELLAKGQAVKREITGKALGIDSLSRPDQVKAWLSRDALLAYQDMAQNPNSKFVISGHIFDEIRAAVGKFN